MKNPHLFSIVTPTFNRGYRIWKTIQSVQHQTYPYWELLIVDDGSRDNTQQVINEFQSDSRIRYIYQKNQGACVARNTGWKHAKGNYIVYLDSDDILYENFLSTVTLYLTKYPSIVFAVSNYNKRIELYEDGKLIDFVEESSSQKDTITLQDYYHWTIHTTSTGLLHKNNLIPHIEWDPKIKRFQDWDFVLTLGKYYPHGFLHIPQVLFEYIQRYGGDSMCSQATYQDWANGFEAIYKKHKSDPLMKNQTWHPHKVEKYTKLQKEFDKGMAPHPILKYFPKKGKQKEITQYS